MSNIRLSPMSVQKTSSLQSSLYGSMKSFSTKQLTQTGDDDSSGQGSDNTITAVFESLKPFTASTKSIEQDTMQHSLRNLPSILDPSTSLEYCPAPPTADEEQRLKVIHTLNMEEANPEPYDNLTALASQLTDCLISCVSIVEEYRQYFPSHTGLPVSETPREYSFCAHAIHDKKNLFVVEDAVKDPRFKGNPLVTGDPKIRFYAGIPLVTGEGLPVGSFCVIDRKPRKLDHQQTEYLRLLAQQAQYEIELRLSMARLHSQMAITERLLLNILPASVIERIKKSERVNLDDVTESFESATILFADIVSFTTYASSVSAKDVVRTLGDIFTLFDMKLSDCPGVTKIKTIGDGYMAVGGVPERTPDHPVNVVDYGFKLLTALKEYNMQNATEFQIRIGINTGPVMAGVVGVQKFTYDCFGDAVNVANRMESYGVPGRIHISEFSYNLVKDQFECEKLEEPLNIKGIGLIQTYLVKKRISK